MIDIFERKFRSYGLLIKQNIARDLKKNNELFGFLDGKWHLKEEGKKEGVKLVAAAKGGAASN